MPFEIRRQACVDSDGKQGSYVVFNTDEKRTVSCHSTREDALAAARIRIEEKGK